LEKQRKIVNRIESLFEKIDKAEALINEAREGFEKRKEAILAKAFRGELTEKWREENGFEENFCFESADKGGIPFEIPFNWRWVKYEEIANFKNGLAKRKGKDGTETIVLRLADVSENQFNLESARSIILTEKERDAYKVTSGDSLIIRVNGSKDIVGKSVLFYEDNEVAFCDHLIRVNYKDNSFIKYIHYLWNSNVVRRQLDRVVVSSAGQNTISQGSLKEIMLPIPPRNEMLEIVNVVDHFIEEEKKLTTLSELSSEIELIRKAILAQAFRGELGTNNPIEEVVDI
jgi:type I restriction enzyme S subunit